MQRQNASFQTRKPYFPNRRRHDFRPDFVNHVQNKGFTKSNINCYSCGKLGHIFKFCRPSMNNIRHFEEENQEHDLHSRSPDILSETASHEDLMLISTSNAKHFGFSYKNVYIPETINNSFFTHKKRKSHSICLLYTSPSPRD